MIVFATDRELWYPATRILRLVSVGPDGAFVFKGLPAGSYYMAAVPQQPQDYAWQEPAFLETLRRDASTVTLSEGQQRSVNLRLLGR